MYLFIVPHRVLTAVVRVTSPFPWRSVIAFYLLSPYSLESVASPPATASILFSVLYPGVFSKCRSNCPGAPTPTLFSSHIKHRLLHPGQALCYFILKYHVLFFIRICNYVYIYIFYMINFLPPLDFELYKDKDEVYFLLIHDHVSQATNTVCDLVVVK